MKNYLMSSVAFAPENENGSPAKTPVQLQREQITVESTVTEDENKEEEKVEAKSDDENTDDKSDDDETKETNEETGEEEKEPVEAKENEENKDPAIVKLERSVARLQRRLGQETGSKKELQKQLRDAQTALDSREADEGKLTDEDVKREAKRISSEERAQERFDEACEKLANEAVKVDKDFDKKVETLKKEELIIPGHMIGILEEIDNGGAVLAHVVSDLELAEDLFKLPPGKLSVKLVKLGIELAEKGKPKPKAISKVPPPNTDINSSNRGNKGSNYTTYFGDTKISDKEAIERRQREVIEKRKSGRPNLY